MISTDSESTDEEQLANITLTVDEDEVKGESGDLSDNVWTQRRILKSHLDVVRAVTFTHGPTLVLATGGDDNTVKVWSLDFSAAMRWVLV